MTAEKTLFSDWFLDGPQVMRWRDIGVLILAVVVPPAVAVSIFGLVGMGAFVAAMPAHLASREGGPSVALLATIATGLGGMLAVADPVMALMVAACLSVMTAIAAHHRLARPAMRAVLTWTIFTSPLIPSDQLPLLLAIYLAGMVWSIVVTSLAGASGSAEGVTRLSRVYSFTFGAVFGIGLTAAVWLGQRFLGTHGFWLPLTFVILAMPPYGALFSRSLKRTLATLAGALASVGTAMLALPVPVTSGLALVIFPLAFRLLPRSSFAGTALMTFSILEMLSMVSDIDVLAVERVESVLLASAMTLGLGLVAAAVLAVLKPEALREITAHNKS